METVADVGGDVLLNNAAQENRQGGGDGYQYPEHSRKGHASHGNCFERDGNGVCLGEADVQRKNMGYEFDAVNDDGGQQERQNREGADDDKKNVDRAGDRLTAAAVRALDEMLFVVGAHGRGEAGDIVTPAGEDISYNLVRAGGRVQAAAGGR